MTARELYPSDVFDDEWALVALYSSLLPDSAKPRGDPMRDVFNGLRYIVKIGAPWRWMPQRRAATSWFAIDPQEAMTAVYQQAQRWLQAGCFERLVHDLRAVLRLVPGHSGESTGAVPDSRTLRSTPGSVPRAAWDGYKRTKGAKLHLAVVHDSILTALSGSC